MTLLSLVIVLAIVAFVCWLILLVPMPQPFPKLIIGIVCLFVVIWLFQQFGLIPGNLRLM